MQFKNILYIITFSSVLGLTFNHFNPKGISLIVQNKERVWTDSVQHINEDSIVADDSSAIGKYNINQKDSTKANPTESNKKTVKSENTEKIKNPIKDFEKPLAISLANAYKLFNQEILFVDARNREDYLRNHIKNSINIPFYQFEEYSSELKKIDKEKPFVIYCNGKDCDMSDMLADVLFTMGYRKIYLFVGGWEEWEASRYPSSLPYDHN